MMKRAWVYCLRLQNGCFYVGQSTSLQTRICEHLAGQGAQWTIKNPPLSVIEAIECPDGNGLALEAAKTAEYCMRYGWKKVRGGSFTRCDAQGPPPWFDETGEKRKQVFYAGLMKNGTPAMDHQLLERWRQSLPRWTEEEYARLDEGKLPTRATLKNVLGKGEWETVSQALKRHASGDRLARK